MFLLRVGARAARSGGSLARQVAPAASLLAAPSRRALEVGAPLTEPHRGRHLSVTAERCAPVTLATTTTTTTTTLESPLGQQDDEQVVINADGTISRILHHVEADRDVVTTSTTVMEPQTFYRRPLPDSLVNFQSTAGKKLFRRALEANYLEAYFALASNFLTQAEPAYCGLSCLSMVLNALEIDPGRKWKGIWRWFSEDMLSCCAPLSRVVSTGITFHEFGCLAQCNGLVVESFLADQSSKEAFKEAIRNSCSRSDVVTVVSYSRRALGQTGDGHFSPIGAYEPTSNMVLILDVARFKYPSYWVHVDTLWEALQPVDKETGRPRGYFTLQKSNGEQTVPAALDQLGVARDSWPRVADALRTLRAQPADAAAHQDSNSAAHPLASLFRPPQATSGDAITQTATILRTVLASSPRPATPQSPETQELVREAMLHPIYQLLASRVYSDAPDGKEIAWMTIFILAMPTWLHSAALARELEAYMRVPASPRFKTELGRIRMRMATLENLSSCRNCGPEHKHDHDHHHHHHGHSH